MSILLKRLSKPVGGGIWQSLFFNAPQSRQHLALLLWPDSSEAQARTNLRHQLHFLRQARPEADGYLEVAAQTLQWFPYFLRFAAQAPLLIVATLRPEGDGRDSPGGCPAL